MLALSWLVSPAHSQRSDAHTVVAHVYVQVEKNGYGVAFLSRRHFSLSAEGQRLPFVLSNVTLSKAGRSTAAHNYLLVLPPFPSAAMPEEVRDPCRAFASVLKAGWRVRIADTGGALAATIQCGTGATARSILTIHRTEVDAMNDLGKAHGRRVILFLSSHTHTLKPDLQKIANDAGAMVYDVGGSETYFVDEQTYPSISIPFAQMQSGPQPGPYLVAQHGVAKPEHSTGAALNDAMQGARGFYTLTTAFPESTDILSLRLIKMPARLTVAAFVSVEDGNTPRLEILQ
jgi:hypothetical protein